MLASIVEQASPGCRAASRRSPENKEIAARLAFKIGSGVARPTRSRSTPTEHAEQSIFGGAVTVQSKVTAGVPVITVRANSVAPEPAAGDAAGSRR